MAIFSSRTPADFPQAAQPDWLSPLRNWLNRIQIKNRRSAHLICRLIPGRCPFERDISLLGRTVHIPALCKINPLYNEVVNLRLRALTYLAQVWDEDISIYNR